MKPTRIPGSKAHADSEALAEKMRALPVGDIYSHATAAEFLGYGPKHENATIRQRYYRRLSVAINLLRDDGLVFEVVHREGYKRLDDAGIVDKSENGVTKIRRRAKRTIDELSCAKVQELSNGDRRRHEVACAQASLAMFATSRKAKNKLIKHSGDVKAGLSDDIVKSMDRMRARIESKSKSFAN